MAKDARKFVPKSVRLMDQVREVLQFNHYALSTEKSYVVWILLYIYFYNKKQVAQIKHSRIRGCTRHTLIIHPGLRYSSTRLLTLRQLNHPSKPILRIPPMW